MLALHTRTAGFNQVEPRAENLSLVRSNYSRRSCRGHSKTRNVDQNGEEQRIVDLPRVIGGVKDS